MIKIFGIFVPKSLILLGIFEIIIFYLSFYLSVYTLNGFSFPENFMADDRLTSSASLFALVMFSSILSLGLYQPDSMVTSSGFLVRLFIGFIIGEAAMVVLSFLLHDFVLTKMDRLLFGHSFLFSLLGILVVRVLFKKITSEDNFKRRVLVLGTGINAVTA